MLPCTSCHGSVPCTLRLFPIPGINPALEVQIYRLQPCDSCAAAGTQCSNADQLVYLDNPGSCLAGNGGGVDGSRSLRYLLNPSLGGEGQSLEWELMPRRVTLGQMWVPAIYIVAAKLTAVTPRSPCLVRLSPRQAAPTLSE